MPGREDLIQQNRAAVRARVENAGEQATTGGEKPVYSSHRSLLGGNLDVASALENIQFASEGPLGDGALRNSVAYIRYWSRPGSKTTAEATSQTVDATQIDPGTDPQSELNRAITERYGLEREGAQLIEYTDDYSAAVVTENNGTATYISTEVLDSPGGAGRVVQTNVDSNTLIIDDDGNILEGFRETRFAKYNEQLSIDATEQKQRQSALSSQIPKTKDSGNAQSTIVANSSQKANTQPQGDGGNYRTAGVGQLKPANPNGFVNTLSRIGRSVLGIPPSQIGYSGVAGAPQGGKASVSSGGTLSKGMWQFLFNPSELEIVAGPEFKAAETWGVSDKANSGQPLNWSHNKNTELKFNSVLLNGFVFGRKVEELEQGIFELFMARDGEGQAGPPVLEFVWGKRVFGPCVIKEISIKEKMWDEGMVVNAELSFTLEQIPEWTINDGYVDVARPGRIPMVFDSTEPSGNTGAGDNAPSSPSDPGAGDNPGQKPPAPAGQKSGDSKLCDWALNISKQFQQLYVRVNNPLTAAAFGNFDGQVNQFYSLKGSLYSGSSEIGAYVDSKVSSGCKKSSYKATTENIKKTGGGGGVSAQQQTIQFIRGCTESTKRAIDEWQRTSEKCKPQRQASQEYARINGTKEQQELCARYSGRCNTPGARFGTGGQCPFVNNNRGVICSGGVWTPL